ncbi:MULTISPECIES: RodZ family helix-turn-helix domain-containing protein [Nostoc]|uniref:Helix-turn-helix domain-containing protein n=1 Tax=Nostoc paludosum FACHB-159 TaxID=2692908 RepID=A0ABR8KED3_9NOSO|nr:MULTISPECIES: helix-turn-helix domain-containing protein [Nostoc]MBD2681457.1 helix-turn-helix domain-containing protein [Nostoc sp. FACHB-857]MBD2737915.1 helix-turn-helix domain-containing protein [Nostoc paludosum FACHB-159]
MVTTPVYYLQILGNPNIEISQDEVRSLLGEIEVQLHSSGVYRRALAMVQKLIGEQTHQAQDILKAVGREAIGLAFRQFAQQYQKVETATDTTQATETVNSSPEIQPTLQEQPSKNATENSLWKKPLQLLNHQKISQAQQAEQAAQQRIDSLRQIGQELQKIRQSKGLSLYHIHFCTHIRMELIEALENGNSKELPDDIFLRGFIRRYGDALGLNGVALAASLPVQAAIPVTKSLSHQSKKGMELEIHPPHLYVGYTALLAGAMGGLALMSQQQANTNISIEQDNSSSVLQSLKQESPTVKPGIKSTNNGVVVGSDISPPEGSY